MVCSLPGSSFHGIFQARVLELGAIAFSDTKSNENQKSPWFVGGNSWGITCCDFVLYFYTGLLFFFFFNLIFWPFHAACGDLHSPTRIKPMSSTVEVWSLNHCTTRQVPALAFLWVIISPSKLLEAETISVTGCCSHRWPTVINILWFLYSALDWGDVGSWGKCPGEGMTSHCP